MGGRWADGWVGRLWVGVAWERKRVKGGRGRGRGKGVHDERLG